MTLGTLVLVIGIIAIALTLTTGFLTTRLINWPLSFLQFFSGVLFIISGAVKAVDPLGTAYKMEQYFAAFEGTFQPTSFSWLAPVFPWMSQFSEAFSVGMIVLEIVLGITLILGYQRKLTAWIFGLLVLFFLVLTGFTYLTGYVPSGVNFFEFGKWGKFVSTNMKVTDCGCFGDFIKLEPKVSFFKDVVLLIPSFAFILMHRKMHQLWGAAGRGWFTWISVPVLVVYCMSNFVWNLPDVDFRPFKIGVNVKEKKAQEMEAAANVKITAYKLTNKADGATLEIPFDQFLKEMAKYPAEQWDMEQVKSKPAIAPTKISEFEVANLDGQDVTEELLSIPGYHFLVIAHHLKGGFTSKTTTVQDTVYQIDTLRTANTIELLRTVKEVKTREEVVNAFFWDEAYLKRWKDKIVPLANAAAQEKINTIAIAAYGKKEQIEGFKIQSGFDHPMLMADDILLKTIIRSNPGVLLIKDGTILEKWHIRQLPHFEAIREKYMN